MRRKILIIGCILAAISLSACQNSNTTIKDNKKINDYEKSNSKEVVASELEKDKDDNKNKDENKPVKVEDKTKNKKIEKSTDVDLSEFDIASEDDDKHSGVMFASTNLPGVAKLKFKKFNGVFTMGTFKVKEGQNLKINYSCELESGKLNILILNSDYKVIETLNANEEKTFDFNPKEKGRYIIKAVGDKAYKGKIVVDFE